MIYNSHYLLIFIFAMNAHLRELLGSVMFSPSIIVAEVLGKPGPLEIVHRGFR